MRGRAKSTRPCRGIDRLAERTRIASAELARRSGEALVERRERSAVVGAAVAYVLAVRFVFHAHRLHNRELEFLSFVLIGLVGLAVNVLVLSVAHGRLGMDLLPAKGVAAGCTFLTNFGLRRQLLFRVGASAS